MKKILGIVILSCLASTAKAANLYHKIYSDGLGGAILPTANLIATNTITFAGTTESYDVVFDQLISENGWFTLNGTTLTVSEAGVYLFTFGATAYCATGAGTKNMAIWMRKNGEDTGLAMKNLVLPVSEIAVDATGSFIVGLEAGDMLNAQTWTDSTTCEWRYTAAGSNPTRPASSSIRISIAKIAGRV